MPHQSRRYTDSLTVRNTSGRPHKPETFPGPGPLPLTAGHHTQAVGKRHCYRSAGIDAVEPRRAGPHHVAQQRERTLARPLLLNAPDPKKLPTSPPAPWALHAGRRAPKLHGIRDPVTDHRREPCDSAYQANCPQRRYNTERGTTDLPTKPTPRTTHREERITGLPTSRARRPQRQPHLPKPTTPPASSTPEHVSAASASQRASQSAAKTRR